MTTKKQELKDKAKVAIDLLKQGADEVSITGTDIKVVKQQLTLPHN